MIILDSCTIILLAKASVLELFVMKKEVKITPQVLEEVLAGKTKMFPDALLSQRLYQEHKIKTIPADEKVTLKLVKDFNMGEGEASSIAAAFKNKTIVGTDNRQGRKAAQVHNLNLIGSLEIVSYLYQNKIISREKAFAAIKILREEGWFNTYLIEKVLEDIQ